MNTRRLPALVITSMAICGVVSGGCATLPESAPAPTSAAPLEVRTAYLDARRLAVVRTADYWPDVHEAFALRHDGHRIDDVIDLRLDVDADSPTARAIADTENARHLEGGGIVLSTLGVAAMASMTGVALWQQWMPSSETPLISEVDAGIVDVTFFVSGLVTMASAGVALFAHGQAMKAQSEALVSYDADLQRRLGLSVVDGAPLIFRSGASHPLGSALGTAEAPSSSAPPPSSSSADPIVGPGGRDQQR
jgi:hypothetical protein